jgi:hypothetical protein
MAVSSLACVWMPSRTLDSSLPVPMAFSHAPICSGCVGVHTWRHLVTHMGTAAMNRTARPDFAQRTGKWEPGEHN